MNMNIAYRGHSVVNEEPINKPRNNLTQTDNKPSRICHAANDGKLKVN